MESADAPPPKRRLPSKLSPSALAFIRECRKPFPEDPDETLAHGRRLLALARQHQSELRAAGVDADAFIADLESQLAKLAAAQGRVEMTQEQLLQSTADLADASRDAFHALEPLVQAASEENPFDPQVQEAKEFLEEWRQHMPKE